MDAPHIDNDEAVARRLVAGQFVLIAALVAVAVWDRNAGWPLLAVVLALAGAMLGVWAGIALGPALTASPIPNGRAGLRTAGPYAFSRHPIYTALLVGGLGLVAWSGSAVAALVWAAFAWYLRMKAMWEEERLERRYPDYRQYAERTARFLGLPKR